MNNKINPKITQNFVNKTQKVSNEVMSMKDVIAKSLESLKKRAEREVPEYGEFTPVYEEFKNTVEKLKATDFSIRITKPPKSIENNETKRYLELTAYRLPAPYKCSTVIAVGNKEEILIGLQDPELVSRIEETLQRLSHNLEDV